MRVSYYQSRLIDPAKHLVVQISNGSPRWGVRPEAALPALYPPREIVHAGLSEAKFSRLYVRHLEEVGLAEVKRLLAEAERTAESSHREAVLCCFESLKTPGQFCHRTLLARWYHEHTGLDLVELGQTQPELALQPFPPLP